MIEPGARLERMKIGGYVALAEHGFAIPAFQQFGFGGNAWYGAIPAIEGDHQSTIAEFETLEGCEPELLEAPELVIVGAPWHDVFLWKDRVFSGTPEAILNNLGELREAIKADAPLSFLDLSLAARAAGTAEIARLARAFLDKRLGAEAGAEAFCEGVVRSGVGLEIRRSHHRSKPDELHYGLPLEFEVRALDNAHFHVVIEEATIARVEYAANFEALKTAISRFGEAIGVFIDTLDPVARSAGLIEENMRDPDQPAPLPEVWRAPPRGRARSGLMGLVREIAIDLGTSMTRVYGRGQGIILSEPSLVVRQAQHGKPDRLIAFGKDARLMQGKTGLGTEALQPLRDGVIAEADVAVEMLKHFIGKVRGRSWIRRPLDIVVCMPAQATSLERKFFRDAARRAGGRRVRTIAAPLAAALGAGIAISEPFGTLLVHIGSGSTEVAVISLRGLAYTTSVRLGGDVIDDQIVSFFRRHHNLLIGSRTAERIKCEFARIIPPSQPDSAIHIVRGRHLLNGIPIEVAITRMQILEAIREPVMAIIEAIRIALENVAPELAADIVDSGIVLTGGGAQLAGLADFIQQETGLPTKIADDPANSVLRGLATMLEDPVWREQFD